jgi:hypothetical protein
LINYGLNNNMKLIGHTHKYLITKGLFFTIFTIKIIYRE